MMLVSVFLLKDIFILQLLQNHLQLRYHFALLQHKDHFLLLDKQYRQMLLTSPSKTLGKDITD